MELFYEKTRGQKCRDRVLLSTSAGVGTLTPNFSFVYVSCFRSCFGWTIFPSLTLKACEFQMVSKEQPNFRILYFKVG
jgi:hypothetical protein